MLTMKEFEALKKIVATNNDQKDYEKMSLLDFVTHYYYLIKTA